MTENTDTKDAVNAGLAAAEPDALDEGTRFYSVVTPADASHEVIDLEKLRDYARPRPRRKTGTVTVHTAEAMVAYLKKHGLVDTEVWADVTTGTVVAVINAHGGTPIEADGEEHVAGWGDHRAKLVLHKTPAWQAWTAYDGKLLGQLAFAEHLEDRAIDVVKPDSATMLEIAQTFTAKRQIGFDSSQRLSTGQVQLRYHEDIEARAGQKGNIEIPQVFELALAPFEGSPAYRVNARLRYRIGDGKLSIGYALERPEDVLREAFGEITGLIAKDSGWDVWHGVPA